ncbi:DUF3617 domain-containing protein [Phenylobacterium sp.]|uniref:DUF3617 domain-containing protein n=1 Tax=Phenylobacterium sp. TaxID=1871053 RepID=UPI002BB2330F|nr:DUF3617 family protein [Phenylobacterium sp.]HLZ75841.1 DUF3617 family protein [Phenylobacterium sp.]
MKRMVLVSGMAVLALAACSKKTDTAATGTAAPANATAPASSGPMGLPSRKAGLWEQTLISDRSDKAGGDKGIRQTISMCLDAAFDQKMKLWGSQAGRSAEGKPNCSEERITQHLGGGWDFHAVCAMGESGTVTSDGQATGDFGSHYTVNVTSTTAGSPMAQANGVHKMSIEGTWKGPCPADMKPGDMRMGNGMTINMAGGTPTMVGGPGGADMAKIRAEAMSGHVDKADIAKLRAQAEAMRKQSGQ